MWRIGVAAVLLLMLGVLVVDMLFGEHRPVSKFERIVTPSTWAHPDTSTADLSETGIDGNWMADVRQSLAHKRSLGPRVGEPPGGDIALSLGAQALARLPSAAGGGDEEPWPGFSPYDQPPIGPPSRPADALAKEAEANDQNGNVGKNASPESSTRFERPEPRTKASLVPSQQIAAAQRHLVALGYDSGPFDGRPGRRTEAAVREFQRDVHLKIDGRIDDRLLARLEAEAQARAQLRQQEFEAMLPSPAARTEKAKSRGIFGSVLGGFQRLLGRDFNSVQRRDELATYCRANVDTWIYDFGREAFVYCGNIVAGQGSAPSLAGSTSETAATR